MSGMDRTTGENIVTDSIGTTEAGTAAWAAFDKTTSRWGRITMILAMIIMIAGPGIRCSTIALPRLSRPGDGPY